MGSRSGCRFSCESSSSSSGSWKCRKDIYRSGLVYITGFTAWNLWRLKSAATVPVLLQWPTTFYYTLLYTQCSSLRVWYRLLAVLFFISSHFISCYFISFYRIFIFRSRATAIHQRKKIKFESSERDSVFLFPAGILISLPTTFSMSRVSQCSLMRILLIVVVWCSKHFLLFSSLLVLLLFLLLLSLLFFVTSVRCPSPGHSFRSNVILSDITLLCICTAQLSPLRYFMFYFTDTIVEINFSKPRKMSIVI